MGCCVIVRYGVGTERREGVVQKEEGTKGEWWLQDMLGTNYVCGTLHLLPPVDPSENVTLMNLKPKTGYNVRVQLSRPGEGGEGGWGPSALMTTDCPGEKSRYIPSCSGIRSC